MVTDFKISKEVQLLVVTLTIASLVMNIWNVYQAHKFRKLDLELKKLEAQQ